MVLDKKQFNEIDDFCDFDDQLDSSNRVDADEDGHGRALSWRKVVIAKAVNNVKKAVKNKACVNSSYQKGALVFDDEAHKFGRVVESKPGLLNLTLLTGGELVKRDVDHLDFIRENRQKFTLPEMAKELFLSEREVLSLLNQLELEPEPQAIKPKSIKKKMPAKLAAANIAKTKIEISPVKETKPVVKIAAKKKDSGKKKSPISFTKMLPKGATTDPVVDPNGYIRQNFLMMNNSELAIATGLSEHTIRRKLGEWQLKRRDFVNKA